MRRMRLGACLTLCRLYYAVPMALTFLLTVAYAGGMAAAGRGGSLAATAALALVIAAGYVFNDVCDLAVDRLNAPRRPLPSGRATRGQAAALAGGLAAGGLGVALLARPAFAAGLAAVAAGLAGYDVLSKRLGWAKQVAAAALMTSIYPLAWAQAGGQGAGPRAASLWAFPFWMFLTAWGYELLKDIRDAAGDWAARGAGAGSLLRCERAWRLAAGSAILLAAGVLPVPVWLGCGRVYAAGVAVPMLLAAAAAWAGRTDVKRAIRLVYAECVAVGLAATADLLAAT